MGVSGLTLRSIRVQSVPFINEADSGVVPLCDNDLLWNKTEINFVQTQTEN